MKPGIKFLNSVFEVAHVEFQTYDLINHRLIFSSGLARRLLGYSEREYQELSADFYDKIVHPDDCGIVREGIAKMMTAKSGEVIEMIVRLRKADDGYVWVYSRQMLYEHDVTRHICTIIREVEDVTKLMELERELQEKVQQLKLVSYKNSHLVRSPVASIIGLVDLIEEQGVTGDHNKQILHFLKEAITKLDAVIRDINETARVD